MGAESRVIRVANVIGTRPEIIKMNPVLRELEARGSGFECVNIITSQHGSLLDPLLELFQLRVDHRLAIDDAERTLNKLLSQVVGAFDAVLADVAPDLLLVQGDTTSALAGALACHHHQIPVGHVEAGLRTGHRYNPFPEEMNRRLITRLASYHYAATRANVENLLSEGVPAEQIYLTGNPVVDSLKWVLDNTRPSPDMAALFDRVGGRRLMVLTTHRRENFGETMGAHLSVLRDYVDRHEDVVLVFPVHPNPSVRAECERIRLKGPRIELIDPLVYPDFIHLLNRAWLILSDSGGVQEEVPTLHKPLIVLRRNTERPEVVDSGFARLVGDDARNLERMLVDFETDDSWARSLRHMANPYGDGHAARAIVDAIERALGGGAAPDRTLVADHA